MIFHIQILSRNTDYNFQHLDLVNILTLQFSTTRSCEELRSQTSRYCEQIKFLTCRSFNQIQTSRSCEEIQITISNIQSRNLEILVQTPGRFGSAQPIPQLITPARNHRPSDPRTTRGPPESPWHESIFPFS